jgi:hypothetical protein
MESATREISLSKIKQTRNEKMIKRYYELWEEGFRPGVILDKLEEEFYLSKPRIYGLLNVRVIQKRNQPGKKQTDRKGWLSGILQKR